MDMSRVWPIVCQFGIGALLSLVGIWCGLRSVHVKAGLPGDREHAELIRMGPQDGALAHLADGQRVVVEKII